MKRRTLLSGAFLIISALMVGTNPDVGAAAADPPYRRLDPAAAIGVLIQAYPDEITGKARNQITMRSGTTLTVDLNRSPKNFEERLDQADLVDQLSIFYPRGCPVRTPTLNDDPGRLRYGPFFSAMYGSTAATVGKNLTAVSWFGQQVRVSKMNGVDVALKDVAADLASLVEQRPELRKYLTPSAGTFNFRTIAGTKRLSMHAYGIAIDLNTVYSDYWRWVSTGSPPKYRNRIPCEIGQVFEQHGFIWGAKWYHYDSMHFEYRPELL